MTLYSNEQNWLSEIKPGDEVLISTPGFRHAMEQAIVARITATQLIVGKGERFNRREGSGRRQTFGGRRYLIKPTPERVEAIKRRKLVDSIRFVTIERLELLPTESLEKAAEALGVKQ